MHLLDNNPDTIFDRPLETDIKQRTISGLLWKLFERGGRAVVELLVQIVLARLLAPEQFGTLAILLVFVNIGNAVVQSGLNTALVQKEYVCEEDYSSVYWLSAALSIALYLLIFFLAPFLANFYESAEITNALRVIALILPINAMNAVQMAQLQRTLEFKKIAMVTLGSIVLSGFAGIALAYVGVGLWALVSQQLIYQLTTCLLLLRFASCRPHLMFNGKRAKELYSFGWKILAATLLDTGYQSASDLIVGKLFGQTTLGLVSQGKKYPHALGSMLDGAIQPVMLATISRIQSDISYVKKVARRALKTSTFLIVPSMVLFAISASPIVEVLLGEKWMPCVPFLQMYCITYMLLPIHTTNLQVLNGLGRSDVFLKLEILKKAYGMALLLFAAFILKDIYLMIGSYIIIGVISTFVNAWPNKQLIGYSYREQIRDISPSFLLSVPSAVISYLLGSIIPNAIATIAIQTVAMITIYLLLARLFHLEAFSYLRNTLKGMLHK